MSEIKISVRYARALFEFAIEHNIVEVIKNDMETVEQTCRNSFDLTTVFHSSIIKDVKKISIIREIFGKHINEVSLRYLEIITKAKRAYFIKGIATQYLHMYMNHIQMKKAHVVSASPLDDATRTRLISLLETQIKSKILLEEKVDESLIGGFILRVGDQQFDSSIKNKIERLGKEFDANYYVKEY